jgi:hypothetical protein
MFIGARVSYTYDNKARAGVLVGLEGSNAHVKFDDDSVGSIPTERMQLINNWKTYKKPKENGVFKTFLISTPPLKIFTSKKPVQFSVGGMRSVWYWANNEIFGNKLKEPNFVPTMSRSTWGKYSTKGRILNVSTVKCHSFLEFTNTLVHEMIHQMNFEVEHIDTHKEGTHGASFLRWVPIIKQKTGLVITVLADSSLDETEHDEKTAEGESKTSTFIVVCFRIGKYWYALNVDKKDNLSGIYAAAVNYLHNFRDTSKVYACMSDLTRVKNEAIICKNGNFPRQLKSAFSTGLVTLLEKTCKPITGYRPPELNDEE